MIDFQNLTQVELFIQLDQELQILKSLIIPTVDSVEDEIDLSISQSVKTVGTKYIVTVAEEIRRLLVTPLGSRVMRPEYGSELYKLRDRELNQEWRLMATKYTFVAINRHIERVRCRKVEFELLRDGKVKMKLALEAK